MIRRLSGLLAAMCLVMLSLPVKTYGMPNPTPPVVIEAPEVSWLDDGGLLRLVNRDVRISKDYEPHELITPKVETRKRDVNERILMCPDAAHALERLFSAALREAGHTLYAVSGYRSYGIQQILFNQKVREVGSRDSAQRTVAPAGASEHQLGLAMDIQSPDVLNLNRAFGGTPQGQWVAENAHRFGYIIRYKAEWTEITGYAYEPWHIRYIGQAHARAVYALNIPYETYIGRLQGAPEYVLRGATDALLAALAGQDAPIPPLLAQAGDKSSQQAALREATQPLLRDGRSYEETLWAIYPTPKPTAGPRTDEDQESSLFAGKSDHGIAD